MPVSVVILAAGQGKRMRSRLPKVLHPVGARSMLGHVIVAARELGPQAIHIVYGYGGAAVREAFPDADLHWSEQPELLGTGDAVAQALPKIPDGHRVLVLCADVPLLRTTTLQRLIETAADEVGLLAVRLADPTGYGRILRDVAGAVSGIKEEKDASASERGIEEVNAGIMCLPAGRLRGWLAAVDRDNAQGELYLTDVIGLARRDGVAVRAVLAPEPSEVQGVNDRRQLAAVERAYQQRCAEAVMLEQGVTLGDPNRFDLRGDLNAGADCVVDVGVVLEGQVSLGTNVYIGAHCCLRDCSLGDDTRVEPHTVLDGVRTGRGVRLGPFARLRPGTALAAHARVGNFVETKNATLGEGAKVNHLSYLGDAELGAGVNIGAGTITCNYDGAAKHLTQIGEHAFVGSNTALVAPVTIGAHATIGAGTVLRDAAPASALTLTATSQTTRPGWRRPGERSDREGD